MRRHCIVLGLVLLAGCMDASPPSSVPSESAVTAASQATVQASAPLVHEGTAAVGAREVWTGSFEPQETCNLGGCATGAWIHTYDATGHVPADLPVRIRAELTYDAGQGVFAAPVVFFVRWDDADAFHLVERLEPGEQVLDMVLHRRDGDVTLDVMANWPAVPSTTTGYELVVTFDAANDTTPAGVPVELDLSPGEPLRVTAAGGPLDIMLFGPDDAFVGRWTSADDALVVELPADAPRGRYVAMASSTSAPITLATNASNEPLRVLPLAFEPGPPRPVEGIDAIEWSFDVERTPLATGIYVRRTMDYWSHWGDITVTLDSPAGRILDESNACTVCFSASDMAFGFVSPYGTADLVPGTYTARYEPAPSTGLEVGEWVVTYAR